MTKVGELVHERQFSDRLQQVDKLKDQFLANTSHELRTPLQGIIGLSEAMLDQMPNTQHQENLSMIISSGKRLNNLVNDILDFSKLKNFDIALAKNSIDLFTLTNIVLKNNAPLIRGKTLDLINAVPLGLPPIDADENRLQQILYNLVGNAVKFTEKGHVKVSALEKEGMIQVAIEDTGTGIPEKKREVIFQEFEQGDGTISREFTGTGLGLSISKKLVELHGGRLWVTSTLGQGSTFFLTLPVSNEKAVTTYQPDTVALIVSGAPSAESALFVSANGGTAKMHILVVDDEAINQQVLKNHLSGAEYRITQAMNGEEAIRAIEGPESFDLVLLDVMMPRMSGYEVCQRIRQKYLPSELPVIMVTAKNQVQDLVQGLALGANDYLAKPFSKEEFLARVQTQLDLHQIFGVTGKFIPNEFLHALGRNRITEVQLGDQAELEVTVLFADIRDYTGLAEAMLPEDVFGLVNAYNRRMGPVIQSNQGFVNQYLGDAIMAIFPKSPIDALRASIEMQHILQQYNRERARKKRQAIQAGMGLHTGKLIMGIIGDEKRMDAATIADTVNTTSRIEGLTKHFGASILLSGDSLHQIEEKDQFHLRYLGKVRMKGKLAPTELYECFDGDEPHLKEHKLATMPAFQRAMDHYHAKAFPEAVLEFNTITRAHAGDQVAKYFFKKASLYVHTGVAEDWTGIEYMDFK